MDKRIIYKNLNGSVGVIVPSSKWKGSIEELADKDVPHGLEFKIVDAVNVPSDRNFRAAWIFSDGIDVDMIKAQEIHMNYLRKIRDEKLKMLDIEQLKGHAVTAEKKALRDMPLNVDLTTATTPEALKNIIPAILV